MRLRLWLLAIGLVLIVQGASAHMGNNASWNGTYFMNTSNGTRFQINTTGLVTDTLNYTGQHNITFSIKDVTNNIPTADSNSKWALYFHKQLPDTNQYSPGYILLMWPATNQFTILACSGTNPCLDYAANPSGVNTIIPGELLTWNTSQFKLYHQDGTLIATLGMNNTYTSGYVGFGAYSTAVVQFDNYTQHLAPGGLSCTITGTGYNTTQDTLTSNQSKWDSCTIDSFGNVTIDNTGNLSIINSTLIINMTSNRNHFIDLQNSGKLYIENSTIQGYDFYNKTYIKTSIGNTTTGKHHLYINNSVLKWMGSSYWNNSDSGNPDEWSKELYHPIVSYYMDNTSEIKYTNFTNTSGAIQIIQNQVGALSFHHNNISEQKYNITLDAAMNLVDIFGSDNTMTWFNFYNNTMNDNGYSNTPLHWLSGGGFTNVYNNNFLNYSGATSYTVDIDRGNSWSQPASNINIYNNYFEDSKRDIILNTYVKNVTVTNNTMEVTAFGFTLTSALFGSIVGVNYHTYNNTIQDNIAKNSTDHCIVAGTSGYENKNYTIQRNRCENMQAQTGGANIQGISSGWQNSTFQDNYLHAKSNANIIYGVHLNLIDYGTGFAWSNHSKYINTTLDNFSTGIYLNNSENNTFIDTNISNSKTYDIDFQKGNIQTKFINTKVNISKVNFSDTIDRFENYVYTDIQCVDRNLVPISGCSLSFTNQVNGSNPSINRAGMATATYTTDASGHTMLPIGNDSNAPVLMNGTWNSTGVQTQSYLVVASASNYSINATITITPQASWYRSNPNVIQNSTQIILSDASLPHFGYPKAIPGLIQAEDFDDGGEEVAYHDNDSNNIGGQYRLSEGVDIKNSSDINGGYNTGWAFAGEWTKFNVTIANTTTYNLTVRMASGKQGGGTFHVEFDDVDKTGTVTIINTTSWNVWDNITVPVSLTAGNHTMKFVTDTNGTGGSMDVNYFDIELPGNSSLPPVPPSTNSTYVCTSNCIHVGKNGSDTTGDGSGGNPYLTIGKGTSLATAGYSVMVHVGTYNEKVTFTNSGTDGSPITLASNNNENVTVNASGKVGNWDGAIHISSRNYIQIIGLTVENSIWNGIMIDNYGGPRSGNITVKNSLIRNIGYTGLYAEASDYIIFDYNTVTNTQTNGATYGGHGQQNENVDMIDVNHFEISHNRIYDTANYESIDVKIGVNNGTIHDNDIIPSMSAGIYVDARDSVSRNISIYNNVVHGTPTAISNVRGIVIGIETAGGSAGNMSIYNNVVYGMGAIGIAPGTSYSVSTMDNISVFNNVAYRNGLKDSWGGGIIAEYPSATNILIKNNIASENGGYGQIKITNGAGSTVDYNLINGTTGTNGTNYQYGNPGFVDAAAHNFQLLSTSLAIDNGTATGAPLTDMLGAVRPQGAGVDIGAYEYVAASVQQVAEAQEVTVVEWW